MFPEVIETDRLRFERLDDDHVDVFELYAVASAPEMDDVFRYVPWERHQTVRDAAEYVDEAMERWESGETAEYVVRPRSGEDGAGEFAGVALLDPEWDRQSAQLAIWLAKQFWGRGYSEERATAFLALAFDRLDLDLVAVTHNVDNDNSRQAIETYVHRFGGRREGVLRNWKAYGGSVNDEVRYTIAQDEWMANRPDEPTVDMIDEARKDG